MVFFESFGDNDFASIFHSVAEERREAQEREQAETLLRLLDELENRKHDEDPSCCGAAAKKKQKEGSSSSPASRCEHYVAITGEGDIVDTNEPETFQGKRLDRKKVYGLEDLPRETEWEMLFGPQPDPEPPIRVKTEVRLKDGKKFYRAVIPGETGYFQWSGVSIELLLLLACIGLIAFVIIMRSRRVRRRREKVQQNAKQAAEQFDRVLDKKVETHVREHFHRMTAKDFC